MTNQQHPTAEQLTDYVHGQLEPHVDAAIHAHLAGCAPCTQAHDAQTQLSEILRDYGRATERELPPGFAQRIVANAVARPEPGWSFASILRPAIALPSLAAIALAAYLGVNAMHGGSARANTIDAAYYLESHAALASAMPFDDREILSDAR